MWPVMPLDRRPDIAFSRLLLPAPDGPMIADKWPFLNDPLILCRRHFRLLSVVTANGQEYWLGFCLLNLNHTTKLYFLLTYMCTLLHRVNNILKFNVSWHCWRLFIVRNFRRLNLCMKKENNLLVEKIHKCSSQALLRSLKQPKYDQMRQSMSGTMHKIWTTELLIPNAPWCTPTMLWHARQTTGHCRCCSFRSTAQYVHSSGGFWKCELAKKKFEGNFLWTRARRTRVIWIFRDAASMHITTFIHA